MTKYLYEGSLSPQTAENIMDMIGKYPYPVEVSGRIDADRFDTLFSDRSYVNTGEGCMGEQTTERRRGIPFGFVFKTNDEDAGFLFLPDQEAFSRFVKAFPDITVNANPFQTIMGED